MISIIERFEEKINKSNSSDCWLWNGKIDPHGYSLFSIQGKWNRAHRVAYTLFIGPIPKNLTLDHLCRVRNCVNPNHLEAVTIKVNTLRGTSFSVLNALKTHCPHNHPYSESNTYLYKGERHCKSCNVVNMRNYRARKINK